jgi:hypothetical protein
VEAQHLAATELEAQMPCWSSSKKIFVHWSVWGAKKSDSFMRGVLTEFQNGCGIENMILTNLHLV